MTGWLSLAGVIIVLFASIYAGLGSADSPERVAGSSSNVSDAAEPDATAAPEEEEAVEGNGDSQQEGVEPTATAVQNRLDCNQIRGTDYLSPEERAWFLQNCVQR